MESVARVASASPSAAARAVSPFDGIGLTPGQTVHAQVTRVEGDAVQLRWGDLSLSVTSRVPLEIGQQVDLNVETGAGGKLLLRMVDDTSGKGRPVGPEGSGHGASSAPGATPRTPAPTATTADIAPDDASFWGNRAGEHGVTGPTSAMTPQTASTAANPTAAEADPLTALLTDSLSGTVARAGGRPSPQSQHGESAAAGGSLAARSALPTYGKLAQSVGGRAAFGQLLETIGRDAGQTLLRAPLSPSDVGRLLIEIGLHPDEANTSLVSEMLSQGAAVSEASVRRLRREITAAGGGLRDAAPAVALGRLGLPITPLSLAVARQLQAGQLDPEAAWGELLGELHGLARGLGGGSQAGVLASELLADWRLPLEQGADGIARWLRSAVDQAATPLEAKLARSLVTPGGEQRGSATPGQDVRARLDLLAQVLPPTGQGERAPISQALQRTQATIQAEQILNGASAERTERTEPKFFAVTLPTVIGQRPSTLELRVRERDAQRRASGEAGQPDVVQMKLNLPGLGDLGVNLMVGQHSVSCHFSAGSAFAEAMLSASSSELVGRLKRLGFSYTSVDAAHERIEQPTPLLAPTPRMSRVDAKA
jgi:hypothetical protein